MKVFCSTLFYEQIHIFLKMVENKAVTITFLDVFVI